MIPKIQAWRDCSTMASHVALAPDATGEVPLGLDRVAAPPARVILHCSLLLQIPRSAGDTQSFR